MLPMLQETLETLETSSSRSKVIAGRLVRTNKSSNRIEKNFATMKRNSSKTNKSFNETHRLGIRHPRKLFEIVT
jgi:hypothetical protein